MDSLMDAKSNGISLQMLKKLMKRVLVLPLREMSLRKVVVDLWNADNMLVSIQNFQFDKDYRKRWRDTLELQMKCNIFKLTLPESVKTEALSLVRSIGMEILRWKAFHELLLYKSHKKTINKHILERLHWTYTGTIDYLKTMKELIHLEIFDVEESYRLACSYCLENEIRALWEQLPEERKCQYSGRCDVIQLRNLQLDYYWAYVLKGEEHLLPHFNLISFNKYAFKTAATLGNKMVMEYFFHKLTSEERISSVDGALHAAICRYTDKMINWSKDHIHMQLGDVCYYLLSLVKPDEQTYALKYDYFGALFCLHDWPWQDVFLDVMKLAWNFFPSSIYDFHLMIVIWNSGYYFPNLFQKLFKDSSKNFRKYFVQYERLCFHFFPEFFDNRDIETIKVVFKTLDVEERVALISRDRFFNHVDGLIMKDEWDMVKLCFREARLSKENKIRLKGEYMEFLKGTDTDKTADVGLVESREYRWKQAFDLLDEHEVAGSIKRNVEDEAVTKDKRLCNGRIKIVPKKK